MATISVLSRSRSFLPLLQRLGGSNHSFVRHHHGTDADLYVVHGCGHRNDPSIPYDRALLLDDGHGLPRHNQWVRGCRTSPTPVISGTNLPLAVLECGQDVERREKTFISLPCARTSVSCPAWYLLVDMVEHNVSVPTVGEGWSMTGNPWFTSGHPSEHMHRYQRTAMILHRVRPGSIPVVFSDALIAGCFPHVHGWDPRTVGLEEGTVYGEWDGSLGGLSEIRRGSVRKYDAQYVLDNLLSPMVPIRQALERR